MDMRFIFPRAPLVWTEPDLLAAEEHLTAEFPRLAPTLRRALVALVSQEIKPAQGREALLALAVRYARECPCTIGMEAALVS